jgi:tetratricopeptide (TPR) repeat protein
MCKMGAVHPSAINPDPRLMSQAARARKRAGEPHVIPMRRWKQSVDFSQVRNPAKLARGIELMTHGEYASAAQIMFELDRDEGPHYEARYFAAILAREAHDPLQGIDLLHEVVQERPRWTEAVYNLGVLYEEIGDHYRAELYFTSALTIDPDFASAWVNLGNMKLARGNVVMALDCFERAITLVPDQPEAKTNAAHALLMMGEWDKGWEYYEQRWRTPAFRAKNGLKGTTAPMWDGTPLDGKTLLVFNEQGFGDTIIMLRYADRLRSLGARLVYRVPPRLVGLVKHHLHEGEQVIDERDELPPHDVIVPFMSLPYHLKTTTQTVPGAGGYLYQQLQRNVFTSKECPRVGLVWAGSPLHKNDRNRSMTPALIAPLVHARPRWHWEAFQVGPHEERARELGLTVASIRTFHETAKELRNLDLLITVDTATAHLAGAMGVRTWLCIPAVPDMRWPLHGMTTPWYDLVRIFRQPTLGDWRSVVGDLHKALERL